MSNRITGTNSGIDVDAVVKASLTNEQNKIDKAYQQQKIYEAQQEQLKEIVNKAEDFYDKYLDILSSDSLLKSSAYESINFESSDSSVTAKGYAGADSGTYSVTVNSVASKASTVLKTEFFADKQSNLSIKVGNVEANILVDTKDDGSIDLEKTAETLNEQLKAQGLNLTAKYSSISGGIVIESNSTGADQEFYVGKGNAQSITYDQNAVKGEDTSITIKNANNVTGTTFTSSTNTIVQDGIEFKVNSKPASGEVTLVGKNDSSKLEENIINFINDYNTLIQTINDKLLEKRDKDYMPLTEDQKEEMTESEIKKWEEKANTGLLRNDSDLQRIQTALKDTMRTFMSSSGLNLEKIGITPVDNYGSKNGTFSIDKEKLASAIENDAQGVKDLFTRKADESADKNKNGGILVQLQSILNSEVKSSGSALSKRIGFEGTSTENSNTLKTYIEKQKKLITELQSKYTTKETSLYNKYSALETMLEKLNAQSNSLYSMLNIG